MGLINDEGKLTPRAYRWRNDDQYKAVCDEILEEVYPQALRDTYHSPDTPLSDVQSWFANDTLKGAASASKHARLYLMLLDGDPSKLEAGSGSKVASKTGKNGTSTGATRPRASKTESASASRAETTAETASAPEPNHDNEPHRASARSHIARSVSPSIHLDFQIHIAPDSSSELIDHIFESMAKHLRSLMNEAGE